jgi:outer membrane protein assembly factor BamA
MGGGLRWGVPTGEDDYVNFGLSYDHTTINDLGSNTASAQYVRYVPNMADHGYLLTTSAGRRTNATA